MTFAVIPAAGKSARMGRPKLALPLGDHTVLERVVASLREAGVEHVLGIIGPHVPQLAPLAQSAGAHVLQLAQETPDMRATVEAGLLWLEERFRPRPDDRWLLVPADHPTLDPQVIRLLLDHRDGSIIVPTYDGRRGHPTVIEWKHVAGMRALPAGTGLNVYLRQHAAETMELPVDSADVLCDLDTPEDYERLRRSFAEGTFTLFVYGTLKRGGVRHGVLAGQRFLREAVTRPKYLLFDLGDYPGLVVADRGGRAIQGELYEVKRRLIPALDATEEAPDVYRLLPVEIEGEASLVLTYIYQRPVAGRPLCARGRWGT
ncbi:MAG TPA: NTP transferase domain-containing protein [Gemmataceae bacterium]|nr:NTP transferase domain-containing protein [Gemmataceae bacterium]